MDEARVSRLPWHDADGYSYGGGVVLTIGNRAILLGSSRDDEVFAKKMAASWNFNRDDSVGIGNG